jgi:flavin-dependent dehydrogenase
VTEHVPPANPNKRRHRAVPRRPAADEADVIVVGAGPAGSTTAFYLAQSGLDVLLLEKSRFPREKVCGDGLTPRAVKALVAMGLNVSEQDGWVRNKGLRVIGAGQRLELPWPELTSYPGYGLVRTRLDLDETLARRAQQAGAKLLEGVTVTGPVIDERTGRITGVTARPGSASGTGSLRGTRRRPRRARCRANLHRSRGGGGRRQLVAAIGRDGAAQAGRPPARCRGQDLLPDAPARRRLYLESWLDLWDGDRLLPGYGWIFGMGDGTSNVGLGLLNTSAAFGHTDYHACCAAG